MRISKRHLRRIIKEEKQKLLKEQASETVQISLEDLSAIVRLADSAKNTAWAKLNVDGQSIKDELLRLIDIAVSAGAQPPVRRPHPNQRRSR